MQKNLNTLHQVVTDARERRQRSEPGGGSGKDLWRADLQPRAAVRARTVPTLERERDALRARLADVRPFIIIICYFHFNFRLFPSLPCPALPGESPPMPMRLTYSFLPLIFFSDQTAENVKIRKHNGNVFQLEKENGELGREIEANEAAQERTNAMAAEIFAFLDEVSCSAPPPFLYCGRWVRVVLILCGDGWCYRLHIHRSTRNGRNCPWRICKRGHC